MNKSLLIIFISFIIILLVYAGIELLRPSPLTAKALEKKTVTDSLLQEVKRYSLRFNDYRKEKGIVPLPDSFVLDKHTLDAAGWRNPKGEKQRPAYLFKLVVWSVDSVLTDRSVFRGPQGERLIYTYSKKDNLPGYHFGAGMWDAAGKVHTTFDPSTADSILKTWGLIR